MEKYELEKRIGSGSFGAAWLAREKATNIRRVMKQIYVANLAEGDCIDALKEAKILEKLRHPNIVEFHEAFRHDSFVCIVMEYCEGGDLEGRIQQLKAENKFAPESQVMDWLIQLAMPLDYMHERRILHRDLKTKNIFIKNNILKLGDFGIAKVLVNTQEVATTLAGTPYYMSPEVLQHAGYNSKSDMWSLGCVMFEVCSREQAFQSQGLIGLLYKICEGSPPDIPSIYHQNLRDLIKSLLNKSPNDRPSASDVLQLDFVRKHMKESLVTVNVRSLGSIRTEKQAIQQISEEFAKTKKPQTPNRLDDPNLTPAQKMKIRKEMDADKRAQEIAKTAAMNAASNIQRKMEGRKNLLQSSDNPLSPAQARAAPTTPIIVPPTPSVKSLSVSPRLNVEASSSTSALDDSLQISAASHWLNSQGKNESIPDLATLNFGVSLDSMTGSSFVPADEATADSYYEDDFEPLSDISEDEDDNVDDDDAQDIRAFQQCLKDQVATQSNSNKQSEISDPLPMKGESKLAQLRTSAKAALKEQYEPIYNFFLKMRRDRVSDDVINSRLRTQFPTAPSEACFHVDQLVYMEVVLGLK